MEKTLIGWYVAGATKGISRDKIITGQADLYYDCH